jgi:DNA-binding transcriptional regulator YiaG
VNLGTIRRILARQYPAQVGLALQKRPRMPQSVSGSLLPLTNRISRQKTIAMPNFLIYYSKMVTYLGDNSMDAKGFKAWRERVGLTQQQIADKLKVTRTTIQNWEGEVTPVPQAVDMSCEIWEARLRQENPDLGPVTLIYSDGPMFVNPYGPRSRPAVMQQEPYPTNTAALARVQQLWGRENFHNAFIIEESGAPLWNVVELGRVVDGDDAGAPTLVNLLRAIAKQVRANSAIFVRSGPKLLDPSEVQKRQRAIEGQADELDRLAGSGLQAIIRDQLLIEGVFAKLMALGTRAPDSLVSNVHQALVVFERNQTPIEPEARLEQGGYVLDYKGYEITYPPIRRDTSGWTVNLCSNNPHLFNKLGGRNIVISDHASLEAAIAKARRHVDELS